MIDLDSDTWRDVAAFVTEKHDQALTELSSPALDFPNTQRVRGQLLALRAVLELPKTQQQEPLSINPLYKDVYL